MFEKISEFRLRNPRGSYFTTVSPRSIGQLGELQIFKLESYSFAVNTFVADLRSFSCIYLSSFLFWNPNIGSKEPAGPAGHFEPMLTFWIEKLDR